MAKLNVTEALSKIVSGILVLGLIAFGLGIILYLVALMEGYNIAWQLQVACIGLVFILIAIFAARLLSNT